MEKYFGSYFIVKKKLNLVCLFSYLERVAEIVYDLLILTKNHKHLAK